jgi:hypothetical protein
VLNLVRDILEEFAERKAVKEPVWKDEGLTLHSRTCYPVSKKLKEKRNAAFRASHPGYARRYYLKNKKKWKKYKRKNETSQPSQIR